MEVSEALCRQSKFELTLHDEGMFSFNTAMTYDAFSQSIEADAAPSKGLSLPLTALWWARKGDWHRAHDLCNEAGNREGDWVHAYLHRVEGDASNASYWYTRADRPEPASSLPKEWEAITRELLGA